MITTLIWSGEVTIFKNGWKQRKNVILHIFLNPCNLKFPYKLSKQRWFGLHLVYDNSLTFSQSSHKEDSRTVQFSILVVLDEWYLVHVFSSSGTSGPVCSYTLCRTGDKCLVSLRCASACDLWDALTGWRPFHRRYIRRVFLPYASGCAASGRAYRRNPFHKWGIQTAFLRCEDARGTEAGPWRRTPCRRSSRRMAFLRCAASCAALENSRKRNLSRTSRTTATSARRISDLRLTPALSGDCACVFWGWRDDWT